MSRGCSCLDDRVKSSEKWRKPIAQRTSTDGLTHLEAERVLGLRALGQSLHLNCACPLFTYSMARVPLQSREKIEHQLSN